MLRHFKATVLILGFVLVALVVIFAGSLYVGACSFRNNCLVPGRARLAHTPIPTLVPATMEANAVSFPYSSSPENCTVNAVTLLSAWVKAGSPETQPFSFTDANNIACQATFADVQGLFTQSNLWYPGALACTDCHNANLNPESSFGLDLSSYAGVKAGSHRAAGSPNGKDILGAGNWQQSILNQVLFVLKQEPNGHPADVLTATGPTVLAGLPLSVVNATPTPSNAPPEIALPSNPGGPGTAVNLKGDATAGKQVFIDNCQMCHGPEGQGNVLNPGSDDGTVPPLNPIDPTIANPDYQTFANNADLFIQNGSTPSGPNPSRLMPPWGAGNGLSQQQIADVIAYIVSLNK